MRKELESAKKMTLIAKLYRMNLLSEKEFEKSGLGAGSTVAWSDKSTRI